MSVEALGMIGGVLFLVAVFGTLALCGIGDAAWSDALWFLRWRRAYPISDTRVRYGKALWVRTSEPYKCVTHPTWRRWRRDADGILWLGSPRVLELARDRWLWMQQEGVGAASAVNRARQPREDAVH